MRGSDERSGSLFSYVDLEARVRADHPLRVIRDLANAALGDLSGEFGKLHGLRPPLDCTGEVASGDAPAGVLWGSLGTASDGTNGVRSSVPLVRWTWGGRCGLGPFLLEEPRPAA